LVKLKNPNPALASHSERSEESGGALDPSLRSG
jgi:hypothetical protein